MKSRLFINYIIKSKKISNDQELIQSDPTSCLYPISKDYFCINMYLKSGVHLTDISSTKDRLWFSKAPIYCYEHYVNCSNKIEIATRQL